jgi:hypothetical protein
VGFFVILHIFVRLQKFASRFSNTDGDGKSERNNELPHLGQMGRIFIRPAN